MCRFGVRGLFSVSCASFGPFFYGQIDSECVNLVGSTDIHDEFVRGELLRRLLDRGYSDAVFVSVLQVVRYL
jgi:hypothetical protein